MAARFQRNHRFPRAALRWPSTLFALAMLMGAAAPMDDATVAFRLRDQFGRMHDAADFRGQALLLVGAARDGRAVGTGWVEVLRALQVDAGPEAPLPVVAVADLRGVPWLLRRFARAQFPDDRRQPVLLDWDGSLARRLALDRDRCTVLVVDPEGRVVTRITPDAVDTLAARAIWREGVARSSAATTAGEPRSVPGATRVRD